MHEQFRDAGDGGHRDAQFRDGVDRLHCGFVRAALYPNSDAVFAAHARSDFRPGALYCPQSGANNTPTPSLNMHVDVHIAAEQSELGDAHSTDLQPLNMRCDDHIDR